jgi:hypothetical protein
VTPRSDSARGGGWELFTDDQLIERFSGATLQLHHPAARETVFQFDAPWERPLPGYETILNADGEYRMYYRGWTDPPDDATQVTAVAVSGDGIRWERPQLGLHEWNGSRANNIVWQGAYSHSFTPFLDTRPGTPATERFKALSAPTRRSGAPLGIATFASADGFRWRPLSTGPVIIDGRFDSQNLAFWDPWEGQYVAYYRDFIGGWPGGIRAIKRALSPDFEHWTVGEWLDYGDAPAEHLYTSAVTPYARANRLYLSFPRRFVPERKALADYPLPGVSDGVFMSSRDGQRWERRFMEAFLRPGLDRLNWSDRSNTVAWGMIETAPDELSLYWTEHQRSPSVSIRRGTVRMDGFVSLAAGYGGGEAVTVPLRSSGGELALNYSTSAVGSVRVEVQSSDGRAIEGHSLDDCIELFGDSCEGTVRWAGGTSVPQHEQGLRLRFMLRDADVYGFRLVQA